MPLKDLDKRKAYAKAHYQANRAGILARQKVKRREKHRAYYERHRANILARKRARYSLEAAKRKARYVARRQELLQYQKRRYVAQAAKLIAYQQQYRVHNPEKAAELKGRRRARERQTKVERINFKKILRDSKGLCGICHKPFDLFGIDFDHIVPLARGGTHTTANIQATHSYCNRAKGAKVG